MSFLLFVTVLAATGLVPVLSSDCETYKKTINVSYANGHDDHHCLTGNQNPCETLTYVLQEEADLNCVRISVQNYTTLTGSVNCSVSNLSIVGEGAVIDCQQYNDGVSFINSRDIVIKGLVWNNCSLLYFTRGTRSALIFSQTRNVDISDCIFKSQWGTGISMFDVGGNVFVTATQFVNSTSYCLGTQQCIPGGAGLHIELTDPSYNSNNSYTITDCRFSNNTALSDCHDYHHTGNALFVALRGSSTGNVFHISRNHFKLNAYPCQIFELLGLSDPHAIAVVSVASTSEHNTIAIENTSFYKNAGSQLNNRTKTDSSDFEAGALAIYLACQVSNCSGNVVTVHSCNFTENSASSGAVVVRISVEELPPDDDTSNPSVFTGVLFTNCIWDSNVANSSGAGVSLFAMEGRTIYTEVVFDGCSFEDNSIIYNPNHTIVNQDLTAIQHYGAIVSEAIPILLSGYTGFYNNSITALYLNLATVKLTGTIEFINNRGIYGGAVYLGQLAWIIPLDDLNLLFQNNRARYGGSIYTTFQCYNASSVAYCTTFGNATGGRICPNESFPVNSSIRFMDNSASISGDAIYLDSRTCSLDCLHGESVVYIPPDNSEVAAPAIHMQFNEPAEQNQLNVRLGQNIFLNISTYNEYPSVMDDDNIPVPAVAVTTVYLNCFPDSVESLYNLTGPSALFLENQPFFSNMRIRGPQITFNSSELPDCSLQFVTSGSQPALEQTLQLNFFPCRLGYVYSNEEQMCVCFDSGNIICNEDIQDTLDPDACVRYGFWFGNISEVFTVSPCPSQYCKYDYGNCPNGPCNILESVLPGFCKLPLNEDQQCSGNRGGILCTSCLPDHAFTFGAVKCVNKTTCTAGYAVIPIILVIVFWAIMIFVLLLILKLNLHVGSGYLYSFIYYFSVIRYITPAYLPSKFLDILVTIFVSIAKVSPSEFIGQLSVCFVESMTVIGHHFFQYLHPVLIALTIFLLVALARFCPRVPNPARSSGVHAICILILLSFSSFVEISLTLLDPVQFSGSSGKFVNLQPDTRYFDPTKHAPYAIVAILILTVLILPFIIILFTAPFLMRCGYNLTRIKPILDEYQACYKDKWRWVAGYYFLCRLIVFLTSIFDLGVYGNIFILQILFMFIFGFHTAIQPYAAPWLNVVDAVLLLNLALTSLLYGSTADQVFSGSAKVWRDILLHVLLLMPFLYFLGIATHILTPEKMKVYFREKWHVIWKTGKYKKVTMQSVTMSSTSGSSRDLDHSLPGRIYDPTHDREPLLALLSDNGAPSAAKYQAVHHSDSDYDYTVQSLELPPVSEQRNSQLWQDEDIENSEHSDM